MVTFLVWEPRSSGPGGGVFVEALNAEHAAQLWAEDLDGESVDEGIRVGFRLRVCEPVLGVTVDVDVRGSTSVEWRATERKV